MAKEELTGQFNQEGPPLVAVSLEEAIGIFDALADNPEIAFGYAADGCYARAHLMCRALFDSGLTPQKAWAFEDIDFLRVTLPDGRNAKWSWHVAPVLAVRQEDGAVADMVFDPGLFDGPVTLQEWGERINALPERLEIKPFGTAPDGGSGTYLAHVYVDDVDRHAREKMTAYLQWQDAGPRVLFPSAARQRVCDRRPAAFGRCGKTWTTAAATAPQPQAPPPKAQPSRMR